MTHRLSQVRGLVFYGLELGMDFTILNSSLCTYTIFLALPVGPQSLSCLMPGLLGESLLTPSIGGREHS